MSWSKPGTLGKIGCKLKINPSHSYNRMHLEIFTLRYMSALPDNKDFMNFNGGGKVSITEGRGPLVVDKQTGEMCMVFFRGFGKKHLFNNLSRV